VAIGLSQEAQETQLAIGQKIVEAHCGRIEVRSAPKRGTTFHLLLPV
jgi:signal transduction histidine kinase